MSYSRRFFDESDQRELQNDPKDLGSLFSSSKSFARPNFQSSLQTSYLNHLTRLLRPQHPFRGQIAFVRYSPGRVADKPIHELSRTKYRDSSRQAFFAKTHNGSKNTNRSFDTNLEPISRELTSRGPLPNTRGSNTSTDHYIMKHKSGGVFTEY